MVCAVVLYTLILGARGAANVGRSSSLVLGLTGFLPHEDPVFPIGRFGEYDRRRLGGVAVGDMFHVERKLGKSCRDFCEKTVKKATGKPWIVR